MMKGGQCPPYGVRCFERGGGGRARRSALLIGEETEG